MGKIGRMILALGALALLVIAFAPGQAPGETSGWHWGKKSAASDNPPLAKDADKKKGAAPAPPLGYLTTGSSGSPGR